LESQKVGGVFEIEGFSRWYKSPEMLYGSRAYTTTTDIWSFGCILAEMLNGVPFLKGMNEIDQLGRVIRMIGSPTPETWPAVKSMPDYGKIEFDHAVAQDLTKVFPNAGKLAIDFLKAILKYDGRLTAEEALQHPYLVEYSKASLEELSLSKYIFPRKKQSDRTIEEVLFGRKEEITSPILQNN
jgi:serine/threonine protein kinase